MVGMWGSGASWRIDAGQNPHEAKYLKLDISKARQQLGWNPIISIQKALDMTVEWRIKKAKGCDMFNESLSQIKEYGSYLIE